MYRSLFRSSRKTSRNPRLQPSKLWLQGLEDRSVPAALMVTLSGDANMADPMDPSSKGDLRYVLGLANNNGQPDTITFGVGVSLVSLSAVGQLLITEAGQDLLIDGGGTVTIQSTAAQGSASRVFNITATGNPAIELKGLTLTGGDLSASNNGGAVQFTAQALSLRNSVFVGNKTLGAGGAVATTTANANLTIIDSTFTGNSANTTGGAVHTGGTTTNVTINGSTFAQNTATTTGGALNFGAASTTTSVTINGPTTFRYNSANSHGGAINGVSSLTLNITNGRFESNSSGGNGAAIATSSTTNPCTISLNSSVFSNNIGFGLSSNGGAVSMNGPAMFEAFDSSFTNNTSGGTGGALRFNSTSLTANVTRCDISGNTGSVGGAIYAQGTLNVFETTIAGNQSLGSTKGGGAIYTSNGTITIRNSTLSGNTAYGTEGGGAIEVFSAAFSGTISIDSSTVTNNSAPNGKGGALFTRSTPTTGGTISLENSIVAGNTASAGPEFFNQDPGNNGGTRSISANFSLIGSNENNEVILTGLTGTVVGASDTMPLNPMLAPLGTNGGIGRTHLPLPGSPAFNAGFTTVTMDQLGQSRTAMTDIGAVEWHVQPPTGNATLVNVSMTGSTYTATVVYSDNTAVNSGSIGVGNVLLSGPGYAIPVAPISATPTGAGTVTATYVFSAPGGNWSASANGTYTLSLVSGQVFDDAMPANAAISGVLGTFRVAIGENFVVTVATDEFDGDFTPGDLSLREAITLANVDPSSPDAITFDPGVFSSSTTMNIGALGQMSISGPVTISGPSATLTVDAQQLSRHFRIDGAGQFAVTLSNFTLTNGKSTGTATTDRGGAILVFDDALTLSNMQVTNNESATAGGAISVNSLGDLTILGSTLSGNAAKGTGGTGGAIYMGGFYSTSLTMTRSTVTGNSSTRSGGGLVARGTVLIQESTIDSNTATDATTALIHGGGILFNGNPSRTGWRIINSTISGNSTKDSGGGIGFSSSSASLRVQNSTVTNNTANSVATTTGTGGGGIAVITGSAGASTITLDSTIVAGNFSGNDFKDITTASTLIANFSSVGVTIMGGIGTAIYNAGVHNIDPLLGPLVDNGGPTRTHALQFGSPMLDAGSNPAGLAFDQRGVGFPRVIGMGMQADIGAFEGISATPGASGSFFDITNPGNSPDTISITYNDSNAIDVNSIGIGDITIQAPDGSFLTILSATPNGSGNSVPVTYQFAIPGGTWNPIDNGKYTVTVLPNQVFDLDMPPRSVPTSEVGTFNVGVAGSITVSTNVDESDSNYSPGDLSLREAIELTNLAQFGASTINFDAAFFAMDRTIDVSSSGKGELKITTPVTIQGPTGSVLTVSGNNAVRVFNVTSAAMGAQIGLANLTITAGKTTGSNDGAGIFMGDEQLTLTNVTMTANVSNDDGGAIYVTGGAGAHLIIQASVFSNNTVTTSNFADGGAIYIAGASTIIDILDSTFSGNSAANGGAIRMDAGTLDAKNSTFSGNMATTKEASGNRGGGFMFILLGSASFTNCTISGNQTTLRDGGAFLVSSFNASVALNNTTVAFNQAAGVGGAFRFNDSGQLANFNSSIVAMNTAPAAPDIAGPMLFAVTGTNNLIGVGDDIAYDMNNLIGQSTMPLDPLLMPLANNGGPTETHALKANSPAIDQGYNFFGSGIVPNDQRGKMRTFDDPNVMPTLTGADNTDIGSFERLATPATVTSILINNNMDAQRSLVTSIKVSFSEAVDFPMGIANAFELKRTDFGTLGNVGLSFSPVTGPASDVTITFNASGIGIDPGASLADGRYLLTIIADNISTTAGTLDGNGNMMSEGSPADNKTMAFHRLFGDADGNGAVNATDFAQFRTVFGLGGPSIFDFNNDNMTNATDFAQFRARFGLSGYQP